MSGSKESEISVIIFDCGTDRPTALTLSGSASCSWHRKTEASLFKSARNFISSAHYPQPSREKVTSKRIKSRLMLIINAAFKVKSLFFQGFYPLNLTGSEGGRSERREILDAEIGALPRNYSYSSYSWVN